MGCRSESIYDTFISQYDFELAHAIGLYPEKYPEIYHKNDIEGIKSDKFDKLVKDITSEWSPETNYVYPYFYRKTAQLVMLCTFRKKIPKEVAFNVMSFLGRYSFPYTPLKDKKSDKNDETNFYFEPIYTQGPCTSCGKPTRDKCEKCDKANIPGNRAIWFCSEKCKKNC